MSHELREKDGATPLFDVGGFNTQWGVAIRAHADGEREETGGRMPRPPT